MMQTETRFGGCYIDTDRNPAVGRTNVSFDARVADKPHTRPFFDGTPNYMQVTGVTVGKTYHIHAIERYGDPIDFEFIDDTGKTRRLMSSFFEPVDEKP